MKAVVNILLLTLILLPEPVIVLIKLFGTNRHVEVQLRHENGVVIINSKKVRVPYTMQETAIPTHTDGIIEYLFLDDYRVCFVTALNQSVMSLLLIFIFYVNTVENWLRKYRYLALKTLYFTIPVFVFSELISNYVYRSWIIDIKNGINGDTNIFGLNVTSLNLAPWSLNLDYQTDAALFVIPLIAVFVLIRNAIRKEETANYTLEGETP